MSECQRYNQWPIVSLHCHTPQASRILPEPHTQKSDEERHSSHFSSPYGRCVHSTATHTVDIADSRCRLCFFSWTVLLLYWRSHTATVVCLQCSTTTNSTNSVQHCAHSLDCIASATPHSSETLASVGGRLERFLLNSNNFCEQNSNSSAIPEFKSRF